ncbi:hypothetical protein BFL28_17450 [Sphingomonas turrisvirgatae]|uniref:HTH-like domain-containing protein n=1 Tax=Sphingomonas turrisvirgatae TaxID=1888892 RepID=A0A1E3LXN7_9SPHN|nr:hypothetical protein BFL28_17450 [Sphingomonas turrisvirgatae]
MSRSGMIHCACRRGRGDAALRIGVRRVFDANFCVYCVRKVWQLRREGFVMARCTVARLLRALGPTGVIGGKPVRTMIGNRAGSCRSIGLTGSSARQLPTSCECSERNDDERHDA